MTEDQKELAEKLANELRQALTKQFVGQRNTGAVRAQVTAYIQGMINQWYETRQLEFAPLPTIDVQFNDVTNEIVIRFFDPETKEELTWADWMERYSYGRHYGRRE